MKDKKNLLFLSVLVLFFLAVSLPANEVSSVWSRLYARASSLSQKYGIMENIVEQHSRDMIPVLEKALGEQVDNLNNAGDTTSRMENTRFTKLVVKELGRLKDRDAALMLWQVVENADDPFLKGEAIIALGRVGARQYVKKMNLMLRNLNFNFGNIQDQRKNEIVAYALVMALERLKQSDSYTPLFFASQGWYSKASGVKDKARKALLTIVDDPTDQLMKIITDTKEIDMKLAALSAGDESKASDENKAALAVKALDLGLTLTPQNVTDKTQLKSLRLRALSMLKKGQTKPKEAVTLMSEMLKRYQTQRLIDEDEMLSLLETFGTFKDDASAVALSSFLGYLTDRRESGGTVSYRISKGLIIAMGNTGNKLCFEELTRVQYSTAWENGIIREAKAALKKLKK